MKSSNEKKKKGFVVLFTVLISSIILAITLGISGIALKEVLLSSSAKEGNVAFFAADSGIECALYWDRIQDAFAADPPGEPISCNGFLFSLPLNPIPPVFKDGFDLSLNNNQNCARVTIEKDTSVTPTLTRIESRGYNTSCATTFDPIKGLVSNARSIERAIRATY